MITRPVLVPGDETAHFISSFTDSFKTKMQELFKALGMTSDIFSPLLSTELYFTHHLE